MCVLLNPHTSKSTGVSIYYGMEQKFLACIMWRHDFLSRVIYINDKYISRLL